MDVANRVALVRAEFDQHEIDGLLVTKPVNVRWLTGFTGSNGTVLVTIDGWWIVTDGRYREQIDIELASAGVSPSVIIARSLFEALAAQLTTVATVRALGFESNDLTVRDLGAAERSFVSRLVPLDSLIDRLRQPKDAGEQARLRAAAGLADAAFADLAPAILAGGGMTERRFARDLETRMLELGADGISFETIVASGPNSSKPHARPSDRVIEPGDLVVIDFGASVDGYGSDMTRTIVCGAEPTPQQATLYEAVATAQAAGVAAVRAGVDQVEVDGACRSSLVESGLGDAFVHGTGHGIGLEIHEQPIVSAQSVGILRADLVVTVEPGAYLPGLGGVRVEDSVVVTSTGCDPITLSPKGLVPWPLSPPTT